MTTLSQAEKSELLHKIAELQHKSREAWKNRRAQAASEFEAEIRYLEEKLSRSDAHEVPIDNRLDDACTKMDSICKKDSGKSTRLRNDLEDLKRQLRDSQAAAEQANIQDQIESLQAELDAETEREKEAEKDAAKKDSQMSNQNVVYQTDYDTEHKARSNSVNPLGIHEREARDMSKRDLGA